MRLVPFVLAAVLLSGCTDPPSPRETATPVAIDTTVNVDDVDSLVASTLSRYVMLTNDITAGRASVDSIEEVTTAAWAVEERVGFTTLEAIGGRPSVMTMPRWRIVTVRGRHTLVDAIVAACIAGGESATRVTIHLLPRDAQLVIGEIVPREDSTWCADSPLF